METSSVLSGRLRLAFGLPFYSVDFNGLMLQIGEQAGKREKYLFFATSLPWLIDYAKNPLLCPGNTDYILASDSNLTGMLARMGIRIKMPLEYFELPEQMARICAHYGFSLMHISDTALKSDILVSDGYVPLSWDLFTHFKTSGELDELDVRSICASANDSGPDILIINAPSESLGRFATEIFEKLEKGIVICIPQDRDRNRIEEKIDNVFSPLLLMNEELEFMEQLKHSSSVPRPSSVCHENSADHVLIRVHGALHGEIIPELNNMVEQMLAQEQDIALDLSAVDAISLTGLEALYSLLLQTKKEGRTMSVAAVSDQIGNTLHRAGLGRFITDLPGIISEFRKD